MRIVGWLTVYLVFLDPDLNWNFKLDILFVYCLTWWLISIIVDSHKFILTLIVESLFIAEWCRYYWDNQTLSVFFYDVEMYNMDQCQNDLCFKTKKNSGSKKKSFINHHHVSEIIRWGVHLYWIKLIIEKKWFTHSGGALVVSAWTRFRLKRVKVHFISQKVRARMLSSAARI